MFTVRGIDDGFAADLCDLLGVAVECPAADLSSSDYVLDELYPLPKPHRQLVKELYVLQEVVI